MFGQFFQNLFGISHSESPTINPATGLPMLDGIGGIDTAGNPFGVDATHSVAIEDAVGINPASGLPMLGGTGLDVGGSPFGTDLHDHGGADFSQSDMGDLGGGGGGFGGSGGFNSDW